jgi:hypothetical protein
VAGRVWRRRLAARIPGVFDGEPAAVGSPGASQLPAPTDPGVTVSRHPALLIDRWSIAVGAGPAPLSKEGGLSFDQPFPPRDKAVLAPEPSVLLPSPAPQVVVDAP